MPNKKKKKVLQASKKREKKATSTPDMLSIEEAMKVIGMRLDLAVVTELSKDSFGRLDIRDGSIREIFKMEQSISARQPTIQRCDQNFLDRLEQEARKNKEKANELRKFRLLCDINDRILSNQDLFIRASAQMDTKSNFQSDMSIRVEIMDGTESSWLKSGFQSPDITVREVQNMGEEATRLLLDRIASLNEENTIAVADDSIKRVHMRLLFAAITDFITTKGRLDRVEIHSRTISEIIEGMSFLSLTAFATVLTRVMDAGEVKSLGDKLEQWGLPRGGLKITHEEGADEVEAIIPISALVANFNKIIRLPREEKRKFAMAVLEFLSVEYVQQNRNRIGQFGSQVCVITSILSDYLVHGLIPIMVIKNGFLDFNKVKEAFYNGCDDTNVIRRGLESLVINSWSNTLKTCIEEEKFLKKIRERIEGNHDSQDGEEVKPDSGTEIRERIEGNHDSQDGEEVKPDSGTEVKDEMRAELLRMTEEKFEHEIKNRGIRNIIEKSKSAMEAMLALKGMCKVSKKVMALRKEAEIWEPWSKDMGEAYYYICQLIDLERAYALQRGELPVSPITEAFLSSSALQSYVGRVMKLPGPENRKREMKYILIALGSPLNTKVSANSLQEAGSVVKDFEMLMGGVDSEEALQKTAVSGPIKDKGGAEAAPIVNKEERQEEEPQFNEEGPEIATGGIDSKESCKEEEHSLTEEATELPAESSPIDAMREVYGASVMHIESLEQLGKAVFLYNQIRELVRSYEELLREEKLGQAKDQESNPVKTMMQIQIVRNIAILTNERGLKNVLFHKTGRLIADGNVLDRTTRKFVEVSKNWLKEGPTVGSIGEFSTLIKAEAGKLYKTREFSRIAYQPEDYRKLGEYTRSLAKYAREAVASEEEQEKGASANKPQDGSRTDMVLSELTVAFGSLEQTHFHLAKKMLRNGLSEGQKKDLGIENKYPQYAIFAQNIRGMYSHFFEDVSLEMGGDCGFKKYPSSMGKFYTEEDHKDLQKRIEGRIRDFVKNEKAIEDIESRVPKIIKLADMCDEERSRGAPIAWLQREREARGASWSQGGAIGL